MSRFARGKVGSPRAAYSLAIFICVLGASSAGADPGVFVAGGLSLAPGQSVTSSNGKYALTLQTDRNGVLYHDGQPLFATNTQGSGATSMVFQGNGNFVVNSNSTLLWSSGTAGHPNAVLTIQNDGNLVISDAGQEIWSSNESPNSTVFYGRPSQVFSAGGLSVPVGQARTTANGQYMLYFQPDGSVGVYNIDHLLWSTNTAGSGAATLNFQSDGNLVLYTSSMAPVWASNTAGHPGATLQLGEDGNLVIYDGSTAIWASNTSSGGAAALKPRLVNDHGALASTKVVATLFPTDDVVVADYDVVVDFNADNTGSSDSTSQIQEALNACAVYGGGTVWMPAGTYKVSDTIDIPAFCTLRGDWGYAAGDPGACMTNTCRGTLIQALVPSGDSGPSVFSISGSASLMGVTIYYPQQSLASVTEYGYTIVIPSAQTIDTLPYHMSSAVINVTLLNSYQGISISTNDQFSHEEATIKNVYGTILYVGLKSVNMSDVDVYENVHFGPSYWVNAGATFNAPTLANLAAYTRANAVAFGFGSLDWAQFLNLSADQFNYGIYAFYAARSSFIGEFVGVNITNANHAFLVDNMDGRFRQGIPFVNCTLSGSEYAVTNATPDPDTPSSGVTGRNSVTLNNCTVNGDVNGKVVQKTNPEGQPSGPIPPVYSHPALSAVPKITSTALFNVAAYGAIRVLPNSDGVIPTFDIDATTAIQSALNAAGNAGGGIVYLPSGWYFVGGILTVPANVELRGSTTGPRRDQNTQSGGSVIFSTNGKGSPAGTALITLAGVRSGVTNLQIFYPSNNPQSPLQDYPYAIRALGSSNYARYIGITNGANGLDFESSNHWIERVVGVVSKNFIRVQSGGTIKSILSNPNAAFRVGYKLQRWATEDQLPTLREQLRANESLIHVRPGAGLEQLTNIFAYAPKFALLNEQSGTQVFNIGADNVGDAGYSIVSSQPVWVLNSLRFNGIGTGFNVAPAGNILLFNDSVLIN
jgi:hypothetical protein